MHFWLRPVGKNQIHSLLLIYIHGAHCTDTRSTCIMPWRHIQTACIQVARRRNPLADAAVLLAIRHAVGPAVVLRADANRRWTLHEAVAFGQAVAAAGLQVSST